MAFSRALASQRLLPHRNIFLTTISNRLPIRWLPA
jgi:hypothetical protein